MGIYDPVQPEKIPSLAGTGLRTADDIQAEWDERSRMENQNPASMYITTLMSIRSRRSARSALNTMSWLLAGQNIHTMPWGKMTASAVGELLTVMAMSEYGLARASRQPKDKGHVSPLFLRRAIVLDNDMAEEAVNYIEQVDVVARIFKECDAGAFEDFEAKRKEWKPRSPATLRAYLSHLRGVARHAKNANQMTLRDYTAIKEVKAPRGSKAKKQQAVTAGRAVVVMDQLISIAEQRMEECAKAKSSKKPITPPYREVRDAALIAIMVGCGLRRDEVRNIMLEDITESSEGYLLLIHGKGNKERRLGIPEWVMPVYKDWLSLRGKDPGAMFVGVDRRFAGDTLIMEKDHLGNISPASDSMVYRAIVRHFGGGDIAVAPHDLRRAFATMMLEDGTPIRVVSKLLGHSSITTTMTYDVSDDKAVVSATMNQSRPL
jgi:integrase